MEGSVDGYRKIDAGGAVQLLTGIREQTPAILLEYGTHGPVDCVRLRSAVEKALDVFRLFRVSLATDESGMPVYAYNPAAVEVYPYDGKMHLFGRESNGFLFRVYHEGSRILLSILHVLTDFTGANEFMKCILGFYFGIDGGNPDIIRRNLAVDPDDARDPYDLYGDADARSYSMASRWNNGLVVPSDIRYRRGEPIVVHDVCFPIGDFISISRHAESSVFPLMAWLTGNALARTYGGEDLVITGAGSFNCRSMFGSRTPLSFSQTFVTVLDPRERHMDMDARLTVQRARMDLELEKGTIARSIAVRREKTGRMMEDALRHIADQDSRDAERRAFAGSSTYFFSYFGHIDTGTELGQHIADAGFNITVTRVPTVVLAFERGGVLTLRIQEVGCRKSIAPALLETSRSLGIPGSMGGPVVKYMDAFPLEELFDRQTVSTEPAG